MNAIVSKQKEAVLLLITLFVIHTWGFPGFSKLSIIQEGVPSWFAEMFSRTFLASFPGLSLSYWFVMVGEVTACVLAVISLVTMEFWRGRSCFLRSAIVLSLFNFFMLGFGHGVAKSNEGMMHLFFYFVLTIVLLNYVTCVSAKDKV